LTNISSTTFRSTFVIVLISSCILAVGLINLWLNIKTRKEKSVKKLLVKASKVKLNHTATLTVNIVNTGSSKIFIRRLHFQYKKDNKVVTYSSYPEDTYKKVIEPLEVDEWRSLIFKQTDEFPMFDDLKKKYVESRILISDSNGNNFNTEWFKQNNLGSNSHVLFLR